MIIKRPHTHTHTHTYINIYIYMAEGIVGDLPGMVEIAMDGGDRRPGEIRFSIHL